MGFFGSDDIDLLKQSVIAMTKGAAFLPIMSQVHRKDGSVMWVEIRASIVMKAGRFHATQIIARDVTERKLAEAALNKNEQRLSKAHALGHTGCWEYDWIHVPEMIWVSEGCFRIFGLNRPSGEFSFEETATFFPEPGRVRQALMDLIEQGKKFDVEYTINPADGSPPRTINSIAELERDSQGKPIRVLGFVIDITERKRAEDDLRKSDGRYRILVDGANEAIVVLQDGMLRFVNPATVVLTGISERELISSPFITYIHPEDRAMVAERYQKRSRGELAPDRYVFRLLIKDMTTRWVELNAVAIDWEGRPATLNFLTDVTERKRAEEGLKQTNEELQAVNQQLAAAEEELRKQLDAIIQGEDERRKEMAFSESLMDSLPGIFYLYDAQTLRMVSWNKNHQEVSGYTQEEMFGKHVLDWHRAENAEAVLAAIDNVMAKGQDSIEAPLVMKDGREIPYLLTGKRFDTKERSFFLGVGVDITERRELDRHMQELNRELVAKEHRLSRLMEQSFDAIFTHREGKIVQANDVACKLIGAKSFQNSIGRSVYEFAGPGSEHVIERRVKHLYDHPGTVAPLIEEKFRRLDGAVIDVEVMATSYLEDMKPTVQVVFRDITERKRLEKELKESEEFHRQLMSNLSLGVVIVNPKTRTIESVNEAAATMFGSAEENIIGHRCYHYLCPGLEGACPVYDCGMEVKNLERTLVCADGSRRPILKTVKKINIRGQERMLECFMDITERERVQSALRETNKKLNLLSSITRHDIRNQLMSLQGNLSLLERNRLDQLSVQHLQKAEAAAKRISAMIQFTKTYEDIGIQAPTWQNVHALVEKCAKEAHLGEVMMVNEVPDEIEIFADPLISKVFLNLIQNAIRHGGKTTTIRFCLEERDGVRAIVCEDDGEGIPADMKEKLFTKGFGKDHGLGLFLSREILTITGITITEEGEPRKEAKFVMTPPQGGVRAT